jgi:hypothetical protein
VLQGYRRGAPTTAAPILTPLVDVFTSLDSAVSMPSVTTAELQANETLKLAFDTALKTDVAVEVGVSSDNVTINGYMDVGAAPVVRRMALRVTVARALLQHQGGDGVVVDFTVNFPPVRVQKTDADAAETPPEALSFVTALSSDPMTLQSTMSETYGQLQVAMEPVLERQVVVLFPPAPAPSSPSPPPSSPPPSPAGSDVISMPANAICSGVKDAATCSGIFPSGDAACVWAAEQSCCRADSAAGGFCSIKAGTGLYNVRASVQFTVQTVASMTEARQLQSVFSDTLGLGNAKRVVALSVDIVNASRRRSLLQTAEAIVVVVAFEVVGFDSQAEGGRCPFGARVRKRVGGDPGCRGASRAGHVRCVTAHLGQLPLDVGARRFAP